LNPEQLGAVLISHKASATILPIELVAHPGFPQMKGSKARWRDALIGGLLALAIASVLFFFLGNAFNIRW
jgi:hypothetical protein